VEPPIRHLQNRDGEDMLVTSIRFDAADPASAAAALDRGNELRRQEEGEAVWHWSGMNQKGAPILLGRIVLKGESLELE
jgi:hypothetical protein